MITQDARRYGSSTKGSKFVKFFRYPGCRFMTLLRMCQQYAVWNPIGLLARIWFKRLQVKFGYQIPHTCNIGKGFFLGHFGNVVVNQGVSIGENCNVAQGVTLGHVSRGEKKGSPTIGSRVWIGANAVVVGKVVIGDDVLIAPLTYVNFDVPPHTVVMGNPGKIVSDSGSEGYINQRVE